jgi:hypothetical protein
MNRLCGCISRYASCRLTAVCLTHILHNLAWPLLQARNQGLQEYGSTVYDPATRQSRQLLDECGIHDCKDSFCGGEHGALLLCGTPEVC